LEWFCSLNPDTNCLGDKYNSASGEICYKYNEHDFPEGPYDYFKSFPIIRLKGKTPEGDFYLNWYPSEYFYRSRSDRYCMLATKSSKSQILMGGSFMRQNSFIFDIENNKLGVARA
jgi:hypothetical protein